MPWGLDPRVALVGTILSTAIALYAARIRASSATGERDGRRSRWATPVFFVFGSLAVLFALPLAALWLILSLLLTGDYESPCENSLAGDLGLAITLIGLSLAAGAVISAVLNRWRLSLVLLAIGGVLAATWLVIAFEC